MLGLMFLPISNLWSQGFTCSSPLPITCGATVTGSTIGVTNDNASSGAPTCITSVGTAGQIWYALVAPGVGTCTINTENTNPAWDTKLHVYTGTCGNLNCVTGDDDSGTGLLSTVTFAMTTGTVYRIRVGGFAANSGVYTLNVICNIPTVGCTDPGACNFSPSVTTDDGSCEYTSCAGCADVAACNFDDAATITDNSECCYSNCAFLSVTGGGFPTEVGWQFLDLDGSVILEGGAPVSNLVFCLPTPGCNYQFIMTDTFGDGWNGATYTFTDGDGNTLATGTLTSGSGPQTDVLAFGGVTPGCTNAAANNFNVLADCDDGSCLFCAGGESSYTFTMFDTGNNGWGANAQAVITDIASGQNILTTTLQSGGEGQVDVCLGTACYSIVAGGGFTDGQISWNLSGPDGFSLDGQANDPQGQIFSPTGLTPGCTNPDAENFDPAASCDDGSCLVCDAGEIVYTLDMFDTFGDGWNGATAVIFNLSTGTVEAAAELLVGSTGSSQFCLGTECYNVVVGGGTFDGEISWTLSNTDGFTFSGVANDPAGQIISPSGLEVGCTNPAANNYNPNAGCDDGSCLVCAANETVYTVNMVDYGNNGWQGANWTIVSSAGATISTGTLASGSSGSFSGCLSQGCYTINITAGTAPAQVEWTITTQDGNALLTGIANESYGFPWGGATGCSVQGCTTPSCNNYNPFATINDNSCVCPPSNDDCANAILIPCNWSETGELINSTFDAGVTSCDATNPISTPGVWYRLLGNGGQVTVETCSGDPQDTKLHIFTGDCGNLQCLTQNDDGCPGSPGPLLSNVSFTTVANQSYYILVSLFSGTAATNIPFTLATSCADCPNGLAVNDECADAIALTSGVQATGSLCCSNSDDEMSPWDGFSTQYGIWYQINSADFDALDIAFYNGNGSGIDGADGLDVGIGVFSGGPDCSNLTPVIGGIGFDSNPNDGSTLDGFEFNSYEFGITITPNTNYYLCLTTSNPQLCGNFTLNVSLANVGCTDLAACNYDAAASINDGTCEYTSCAPSVENDSCINAIPLVCDASINGSTGASTAVGAPTVCPAGSGDNGVWYTYAGDGQFVTLSTCGSDIDSRINVLTSSGGCDGVFACEVSADDDATNCGFFDADDATVEFVAEAGTTYYIYITAGGVDTDGDFVDDLFDGSFVLNTTCDPVVEGCTDDCACNYLPEANIENNTCEYFSCVACDANSTKVRFDMSDTFGDGWNGNTYSITNATGDVVASGSLNTAFCGDIQNEGFDVFCLAPGCYIMTVGGGAFAGEVVWSMTDEGGNIIISAASPNGTGTFDFVIGDGICGCTDQGACNYDNGATLDNGTCEYLTCSGCMDPTACNYDNTAIIADIDACCFSNCVTLNMFDSFGDGWNGAVANIFELGAGGASVGTGTLPAGTSEGTAEFCLVDGCYQVTVNSGTFPAEVSWNLTDGNGVVLLEGGAPETNLPFSVGESADCGCTDATACNYNPAAIIDIGNCEYLSCQGCTDATACNYDATATQDDGSCCFSNCVTLNMFDTFGDGWNGAVASIADFTTGTVISTATLPAGTSEGTADFCLVDGCYEVQVTAGTFPGEVDWTLEDGSGSQLAIGGAPETGVPFSIGSTSTCGCTDPTACNFNPNATLDIGNCEFTSCVGCTDPSACNYEIGNTQDDGTCCFSNCFSFNMEDTFGDGWDGAVATFTDVVSGTVVGTATLPAGTSEGVADYCLVDGCYSVSVTAGTFPGEVLWTLTDGTGAVILDGQAPETALGFSAGAAVCDPSCTDTTACNFDANALISDNTLCDYTSCVGCSDPTACNYDVNAPAGASDCDYSCYGCSDVTACNYSVNATFDDGSCEYPGCTDALACNYALSAACDDGTCVYPGCIDAVACNYDQSAGCDDGSCCFANCAALVLTDGGGNGWEGAEIELTNAVSGEIVLVSTLNDGSFETQVACLVDGCYDVAISGGSNNSEIGWSLEGITGDAIGISTVSLGVPSCDPACIIPIACNFNPQGIIGDCNLCEFDSCLGCTYVDATNYNPAASIDDGSCIFELGNPNCPADINGDGFVSVADLLIFIAEYGTTCN